MQMCVASHRLPTNSSDLTSTWKSPHPSDPNLRDPGPILGRATIRAGYAFVSEKDHRGFRLDVYRMWGTIGSTWWWPGLYTRN